MRYSHSESNTLSRRYELPTCLLEVWTEQSPLSDWQSQVVAQNLQFRLQLADGKKVIKGNQQQIANLIEIVTAYCDRWLAQDDFESLNHAITIPKLPKLQLSTLQLFDLYESLERCSNEFIILPNLVLEVRRLHPNWLKIVAGAIAIVGVSIGTVRLISSPFGEQPSYQIASTPSASDPEKTSIIPSVPPAAIPKNQEDPSRAKVGAESKAVSPSNPKPNLPTSSPSAISPASPSASPSDIDRTNRNYNNLEQPEKVAIVPESSRATSSDNRQREINNLPAVSAKPAAPISQPRRLDTPNKDNFSQPITVTGESAPSSSDQSAKLSAPFGSSNVINDSNSATSSIKVLQIQSELPSDLTASLVRYVQSQQINIATAGTIVFDLEIVNDRVVNISTDKKDLALKVPNAIAELEKLILEWRSPNPIKGKLRMVLQVSP